MVLGVENIRTILYAILCLDVAFYLFIGIDSYNRDNRSKGNIVFFILCIFMSLWAIGYGNMLISPNLEVATIWWKISAVGWCYFGPLWLTFAFYSKGIKKESPSTEVQFVAYVIATVFFINCFFYEPSKMIDHEAYGYIGNLYTATPIGKVYSIYIVVSSVIGFLVLFFNVRNSQKNRIRKQQRIILITCLITFIIGLTTDVLLSICNIRIYPMAVIGMSIGMGGIWYAINRHRFMSITPKFVSEHIFEGVNEPIFILGEHFLVKNCNEASLILSGYNYKDLEQNSITSIIDFRDFNFSTIMEKVHVNNIEVNLIRKNKEAIVCELSATVIYDEYKDIIGIVVLLHDISERKKLDEIQREYTLKLEETNFMLKKQIDERILAEEKIRHFIYYDALTEISNRKKMMEDINALLEDKNGKFAVLFIDLDKFKGVNDNYGHKAGDHVLKHVAMRLKGIVKCGDTVSRIGGDEFILILRDLKTSREAEEVSAAAMRELSRAFTYKSNQLFIGGSIGISIFPDHGDSADMLINKADLAMYEAKKSGGDGYALYNDIMDANVIDSLEIKRSLKNAIENNELVTYYQPIIDLKSMKILNAESLIRWKRQGKIVPPMEFIPVAKKYGEIVRIDNWILDNACAQCKKWHDMGVMDFGVSVNTSYKQLTQLNFVQLVMETLEKHSLEPGYLHLEITEDEAMTNPELIIKILLELRDHGVKISMDDFGTGYSSLSYINKLPIDTIKIDRSLIINLENNYKNLVIVKAIIAMAHSLDIKIVAEGIETEAEFEALMKLNCDYIQGYLIGKPMVAEEFQDNFLKLTE